MDKYLNITNQASRVSSLHVQATALGVTALCGLRMMMEPGHRLLGGMTIGSAAVAGLALFSSVRRQPVALSGGDVERSAVVAEPEMIVPVIQADAAAVDAAAAVDPLVIGEDASSKPNEDTVSLCVLLYDELDQNFEFFDEEKRSMAEHVMARLEDILVTVGAGVIRDEAVYDRLRHQPDKVASNGVAIAETLRPGFVLGRKVLRRARVRIA